MGNFDFLTKFVVEKDSKIRLRHTFHSVEKDVIQQVDNILKIPVELKKFYLTIGHGFMFDSNDSYSIDKFYDPIEFKKINLHEDYYQRE
jgi:hypothetical protein